MSYGARYLSHTQGAADHRLAASIARVDGLSRQQGPAETAAEYHERRAAEVRSQLAAARKLGLKGSAGTVPANYFADAPFETGNRRPGTGN